MPQDTEWHEFRPTPPMHRDEAMRLAARGELQAQAANITALLDSAEDNLNNVVRAYLAYHTTKDDQHFNALIGTLETVLILWDQDATVEALHHAGRR